MKDTFKDPRESLLWCAKQNEKYFDFEAAARIYRQLEDFENAQRCDRLASALLPKPQNEDT